MAFGPPNVRPPPVDNLRANVASHAASGNRYSAGEAVVFTWNYRVRDGQGRVPREMYTAGPIGAGKPTRIGKFELVIMTTANVVKRTVVIDNDDETYTYPNATMVTDFTFEPPHFRAKLTNVNGTWRGPARTITITKV